MKSGSYMILYATGAEGEMQLASYRNAALYTEGKVGYAAFGCTASFGAVTRGDASYVAYDWYEENGYFVRAAQKGAVAIGSDGSIVFGENAVTAGDDTLFAAAYRPSGYYDMLTTSAVFGTEAQPVGEEAVYGIYGWIQDGEQYLAVYVSADGVTVENHFAQDSFSETYALPSGFVFAGSKTLTVSVACDGAVSVALSDGTGTYPVVGEGTDVAFLMRGHDREAAIGSGVLVGGAPVTVTGFSSEGYEPYSTRQEGEWSLRGPRYSTWDIAQDGTITARGGAAEDALRTVALVPHGQKDFYFGTRIRVTAMAEGENKAGLVPYYLDENNYLFVWLDQWSGSASAVNIAGKLGGVPYINGLGEDWNAYYVDYRYLGADNELEVQISGDMLYIYLNRQFAPVVALELEGFGERPLEGAAAGVSVLHSDAAFAEGVRFGTERIFRAEEKPTVHMNGRLAEEAALGEQVVLPDFSAVSADGQALAPDVAVTDPSGGTVDVSGNAFTADKEGVYTVTVSAVDVWGNRADPLILQVAVQGAAPVRTLHALTQEQTAVRTGEMVILPLYADGTGAEIAVVYSVTAPDGSAVAVTENTFRAEQEGEYGVAVSAENAEGLTFTVVAEKAEPAQPEPVWVVLCFAIPVLLVAAAAIVFCGKRSLPKGK